MKRLSAVLSTGLLCCIILFSAASCQSVSPQWDYTWEDNGDMEILRERMVSELNDPTADPSEYLADMNPDGSFASIDYDTQEQDTWHPIFHLEHILLMQAAAYTPENKYYLNGKLIKSIGRAIGYWVQKDYYCEWNGWWNGLGSGPKIADILLYPNNGVDSSVLERLTNKLRDITCFKDKKKYSVKQREINSTGGNLTDKVIHSLKYAVLTRDGGGIKFLRRLMENELRPFPSAGLFGNRWDAEGIKADMSFQQHYEMLYVGGYGEVFANGMNSYIRYTAGTQFGLSAQSLEFYQDFLLDGMQYSTRGGYRDINASGRGIVRKNELTGIYGQVREGCEVLLNSGVQLSRTHELFALMLNRTEDSDIGAGGHKYFWNSDYQVYNDVNYTASVRAASKRTKNSEALNGENVWGHYLGAGTTMYYVKGDEYYNIAPLLNWNKIPGTTAVQGYMPYGSDSTYSRMGKTSFVSGVSNGKVGMSCLDYNDNYVKARKAWFMFEDGVVCLGSDISSSKKGDLFTCINQTLLRGDVVYSCPGNAADEQTLDYAGKVNYVYNNGIGYITESPVTINAEMRAGDWKRVSERQASEIYRDSVFEIGISHGSKAKKVSYDYTVLMNTSPERLKDYASKPNLVTVANNSVAQAVTDIKTGITMAVFWKKGELVLLNGTVIKANAGCTLIYEEKIGAIYVADAKQNGGSLKIRLDTHTYSAKFDKGMYSGKTIRIK